jgi:hypothetical protein
MGWSFGQFIDKKQNKVTAVLDFFNAAALL